MSILNVFPLYGGDISISDMFIKLNGTNVTTYDSTMGGIDYRVFALTSSGTLELERECSIDVCVVGGGGHGENISAPRPGYGGAGGYLKNQSIQAFKSGTVVVGAANGASSLGSVSVNAVSGQNGGTGGGGGLWTRDGGTGDGVSKYPFGVTTVSFTGTPAWNWSGKPLCGGGAGGWEERDELDSNDDVVTEYYKGGDGGTNGGNGVKGSRVYSRSQLPSSGGAYGAGSSIRTQATTSVVNATWYGSGGAGENCYGDYTGAPQYWTYNQGLGYQGIVIVRIRKDQ